MRGRPRNPTVTRATTKHNMGRISAADELEIWNLWVDGHTQFDIAARYGISQPRVSGICAKYGELIPAETKEEIGTIFLEQIRQLLNTFMPLARRGDNTAARTVIKAQERACRMLGLDKQQVRELMDSAAEPVRYIIEAGTVEEAEEILDAIGP